jgi:serine/threonine-protein kinase
VTAGPGFEWSEADRLFDLALEIAPAGRAAWVAGACGGNRALQRQVEALLRADAAAGRFLELDGWRLADPATDRPAAEPERSADDSAVGRGVGPSRIVRQLARGGMGVVYLAERADGQFEQRVALKLIRKGIDSAAIHRRFLAERQILARLNHPHIARLLDGGVSAQGQPYFAIEYVEGTTIVQHCEAQGLGVDERLGLFLDVCDAVRYAHQNLVVHRDLKPSNILVTADGQAKLLDFGIAKLLDRDHDETESGVRVMTPEYAAPEQVRGDPVTTATDVYALGAVLYELLAGQRMHRFERRSPTEMVRTVLFKQPQPPSSVAPAARRGRLRGDLDAIVLAAVRKERDERYPAVEQLAGDVQRYLDRMPVSARSDGLGYRAAKFVRRHRLTVAASGAIALSLLAAVAGMVWQARAAAERARAASAEAATGRAVRTALVQLFEAPDPGRPRGHELSARELLDRDGPALDTALAGRPEARADLLALLAAAHRSLGDYARADTLLAEAVALTRTLPGDVRPALAKRLAERAANLRLQGREREAEPLLLEAKGYAPQAAR